MATINKIKLNGILYDIGMDYSEITNTIEELENQSTANGAELTNLKYEVEKINSALNQLSNTVNSLKAEPSEITMSWDEIKDKINRGKMDDFKVGDYKRNVTVDGYNSVTMRIAGINTYKMDFGSTKIKNHIDWISDECTYKECAWYSSDNKNNNGTADNTCPFLNSELSQILNDTIFNSLPKDLREVISEKRIDTSYRYSSSGILSESNGHRMVSLGKIWLPTEYEVFGYHINSSSKYSSITKQQYPLFRLSDNYKIKIHPNYPNSPRWWLMDESEGNSTDGCYIYTNIPDTWWVYNVNKTFIPLCFRIMED